MKAVKTIGVFFNPHKVRISEFEKQFASFAKQHGVAVKIFHEWPASVPSIDVAIAFGGDGTILRLGRYLAGTTIPICGVNMGRLGFLAETNKTELWNKLDEIVRGKHALEQRMLLDIVVRRNGVAFQKYHAVNDVVIKSGERSRIVDLTVHVDKEFVADYTGDGVIIATPTGSTAYALASGGPIVYPTLPVFIIAAICPHTFTLRPLLVGANKTITVSGVGHSQDIVLCADGQVSQKILEGDEIIVKKSAKTLHLVTTTTHSYFEVLQKKMAWGSR